MSEESKSTSDKLLPDVEYVFEFLNTIDLTERPTPLGDFVRYESPDNWMSYEESISIVRCNAIALSEGFEGVDKRILGMIEEKYPDMVARVSAEYGW